MGTIVRKDIILQKSQIERATAGEALSEGELCYLKSDGKYWLVDADAAATTIGKLLIAGGTIAADAEGEFLKQGDVTGSALTIGGALFASVTPGAVSQTAPVGSGDQVRILGYAVSATLWTFSPSDETAQVA